MSDCGGEPLRPIFGFVCFCIKCLLNVAAACFLGRSLDRISMTKGRLFGCLVKFQYFAQYSHKFREYISIVLQLFQYQWCFHVFPFKTRCQLASSARTVALGFASNCIAKSAGSSCTGGGATASAGGSCPNSRDVIAAWLTRTRTHTDTPTEREREMYNI